ncbi:MULTISPECIES: CidA/LrgA family protein [Clostridium]|uniref:CidA/LrgA family protein n=1 Tax=Clostridium paridis TaxID=2803863 RepID=A0A937FFS9_9CLOT|nr:MULTISPECIES: CidA/LrgA family protein [Clostridium]MBL4931203.1 CidA/LrgA family protein [Clostridium paridis]
MKLLRELLIITLIYFLGEVLSRLLHIPIPGNILGMLILLACLCTNLIKLHQIEKVANFFLNHLSFFFIPAGVGLITSISVIKDSWYKLLVVCILTTIIVMVTTGHIVQFLVKFLSKGSEQSE